MVKRCDICIKNYVHVISLITCILWLPLKSISQTNQTVVNGAATAPVTFSATGCVYNWSNNTPGIGLPASGIGNIPSFTAVNNRNSPITATITATPVTSEFAYIANALSNTVSVVSIATNTVITSIPVGKYPWGVFVSPDGTTVYVANESSNSISVIKTATNTVAATIPVGNSPTGLSISPDGSRLYIANDGSNSVSVINTSTNLVISTIAVGLSPLDVSITPDGNYAYVTNGKSSTVSVISIATGTVVATIPVSFEPLNALVSADGKFVYISSDGSNYVSIISTATNTVTGSILIGSYSEGLVLSRDGKLLYATNATTNSVYVISTTTNTVISTIAVGLSGFGPQGISVSADGSLLYTATRGNFITVINTATNSIISNVTVGSYPTSFGNFITRIPGCSGAPITFTITVNPSLASPAISSAGALLPLTTTYGTPSSSTSFNVSGINLTTDVAITSPAGFEVSSDNISFSNTVVVGATGSIASAPVYIRLKSSTPVGNYSGNIGLSTAGGASLTVAVPNSSVNPASLTIKGDDETKFYGEKNPVLTISYQGFVNNEGPAQLITQPAISTAATTNSPPGNYTITVSGAVDANYTFIYIPGTLTIKSLFQSIVIPNTFTPNGDGCNDVWNIKSLIDFPDCIVRIYTKYGNLIYQSRGYSRPWDGTVNGSAVPVGTYYYIINLQNSSNRLAGLVTIVR